MATSIERMMVELGGDERPLRMALQRSRRDVEEFQAHAARVMAKPLRTVIEVDTTRAKRQVADVDDVIRRAYARWNKPVPNVGPSALSMGLMGATGRFGNDDLPAEQVRRMVGGGGNGIVTDMLGFTSQLPQKTGEQMAKELMSGLRRTYRAEMADAREELFRGLINPQEFEQRSRVAAQAMNRGILRGIERIGDSGKMTGTIHAKLVSELQQAGLAGGDALARAMEQRLRERQATLNSVVAGNMRRAMGVQATGGGGFLSGIGRGNAVFTAAISAGFGLEQIARAEGNVQRAAAGIRTALQTTATFAASALGPKGMLFGALALGTSAIIDLFAGAKQEMTNLRQKFEEDLAAMIDAGDTAPILVKIRDIEFGKPSAGMGLGGGFAGSLRDLETLQARDTAAAEAADRNLNIFAVASLKKAIDDRAPLIEKLKEQRDQLRDALLNRPDALPEIRGLPAVRITANAPGKQADDELKDLSQRLSDVTANIARVRETMSPITGLSEAVDALWSEIDRRIQAAGDGAGRLATQLRGMRDGLAQAIALPEAIAGRMPTRGPGAFAPPRVTPSWPQITIRVPDAKPPTQLVKDGPLRSGVDPDSLMNMMRKDLQELPKLLKQTVVATFGPIAVVMRILEPGLRIVSNLLDTFITPLAAVVEVVAVGLEPVLRLLFPIIKGTAWIFSFLYEVVARVASGLARAIGNVIVAIGKAIDALPFVSGKGVIRAGESILKFADGVKQSADQMMRTRKRLEGMEFGDTARDVNQLGDAARGAADALSNVPDFFRLTLQQLRHFGIDAVYGAAQPTGGTQAAGGVTIQQVTVQVRGEQKDPRQTAREVVRELELVATGYGMTMPWSQVPSTAV